MEKIILEIIKVIHIMIDLLICSYIFIFSAKYDIYFVCFILLQTLHWIALKNECILSYFEKKLIDPNYELGNNIKHLPHAETYHTDLTLILFSVIVISTFFIIFYRSESVIVRLFSIIDLLLFVYLKYLY
jgi:hypothetical protein